MLQNDKCDWLSLKSLEQNDYLKPSFSFMPYRTGYESSWPYCVLNDHSADNVLSEL